LKRLRIIFTALLTALVMVTNFQIPTPVAAANNTLQEMYDSLGYKALEYLGYDSTGILKNEGKTFNPNYVGKSYTQALIGVKLVVKTLPVKR
jgi:hypothetical protein